MKTDLDALMQASQIDAILITGSAQHNPAMFYMTGGAHMTGDLIKKRGQTATVFCNPMERDEAAKSSLPIRSLADYKFQDLLKEAGGDHARALAARYRRMFQDLDIHSGRVALYGKIDAGLAFATFSALQQSMPEITLVGEVGNSVILQAMMTKELNEVERIRKMGKITTAVVGQVAELLTSQAVRDGVLVKGDGQPLTIGEVKNLINLWLAERGAENPEGTIFAIGRDAGVPHSSGNPDNLLRLGQTIVFDIYPCEPGGGYFYDFTRTWCLGYVPDEVQALYEDVRAVYEQIMQELKVGTPFKDYQSRTCDLFEERGHPTVKSNPQTQEGYVHSLGHGVGLHIHERPASGITAAADDILIPGVVATIEPGLYYPERGMGVRLEDTAWVRPDGQFEVLAAYPHDLLLPVKT
ncbi:MAG: aminopeptidase P family protein [Anaerolineales bacterium]|nr:aminopeptidase P family protein [Anaerolineales bacterium]